MCHPLATVVPYPQWPSGRWWARCGLKMIPLLTSSRAGCREGAPSLCEEGERERKAETGRARIAHTYLQDQYLPKNSPRQPTPAVSLSKVEKLVKWNWLISLGDFINFSPNMSAETWSSYCSVKVYGRFFFFFCVYLVFRLRLLIKANAANNELFKAL